MSPDLTLTIDEYERMVRRLGREWVDRSDCGSMDRCLFNQQTGEQVTVGLLIPDVLVDVTALGSSVREVMNLRTGEVVRESLPPVAAEGTRRLRRPETGVD